MWKVNILKNTRPSTKLGREKLLAVKSCFVCNWSPPHFFWSPSKLDSTLLSPFLFFCFWNPYRFISLPQGEAERFLKDNWQSAEDNCIWSLCFSRVFRALGYFNSSFNVLLKDRETKRVSYYLSKVLHVCYFESICLLLGAGRNEKICFQNKNAGSSARCLTNIA